MSTLRATLLLTVVSLALFFGVDAVLAQTDTPDPPQWRSIDLGVPGGNAYSPLSVTVDPTRGLAYVFSGRVPEVDGIAANAVTVVRLRDGRIIRRGVIDLGGEGSASGELWVSRDGRRGYLLDSTANQLYHYNPATDDLALALTDVRAFTVSPNQRHIVVRHFDSLAVYTPDLRTLRWRVFDRPQHIAASDEAILVQRGYAQGEGLALLDLEDGTTLAATQDPGWVDDLAIGPGDTWFVGVSEDGFSIRHLDSDLAEIGRVAGLSGQRLFFDTARAQLLVTGQIYPGGISAPEYWLWSLSADDLSVQIRQRWSDWAMPRAFAVAGNQLAGIYEYDENDRLYVLDAETLDVDHIAILGVRLSQIVVDGPRRRLYVADNQERIYAIDAATGAILNQWRGHDPLALDSAHGVLYANRYEDFQENVVALDVESGDVMASFAHGGVAAPDPNRALVYIADGGVYVYNRAGDLLGQLDSTFPDPAGFVPNPYVVNVAVNPLSGALVVVKNNGVPGSNNRNFAVVFAPPAEEEALPADEPQSVPGSDSVSRRVIFAPDNGDAFLTTYGIGGATAILRLDALGNLIDEVGGRTGILHYHPNEPALYVQERDVLARFDADLELTDFFLAPIDLDLAALDDASGEFFYQATWMGPILVNINLNGLAHLHWDSPGGFTLPTLGENRASTLTVIETDGDTPMIFVGQTDGDFFQSVDGGQTWRQRYLGSTGGGSFVTAAADGALYFVAYGSANGDGVFVSEDGGDSWQLFNRGLTDLKIVEPIHTVEADRLYAVSARQKLFTWTDDTQRWREVALPADVSLYGGVFHLAPDESLYLVDYTGIFRSQDHGQRWTRLGDRPGWITTLVFADDFATSGRIYTVFNDRGQRLLRSDDFGASWQTLSPGIDFVNRGGESVYLKLMQGDGVLYLAQSDIYQLQALYRSGDGGESWQMLTEPILGERIEILTLSAEDILWYVRDQAVASLDLAAAEWTNLPTRGLPTATPLPTPTAQPTPTAATTPGACEGQVDNAETIVREAVPAIGCPQGDLVESYFARQPFEHGEMIWRKDNAGIYVLYSDGHWQFFPDTWDESQPQSDPALTPPTDRFQPVRGFGKIWRNELGGPDASLGWALSDERGVNGHTQAWTGGELFRFEGDKWVVLLADGRWR